MAQYNQTKWVGVKPTVQTAEGPGKQVTITSDDTEILAANDDRTGFALIVRGAVSVFIKLGTVATVNCPELEPGDVLACNDFTGAVHGIVSAADGRVDVFEV